jgi:hypothetical protein
MFCVLPTGRRRSYASTECTEKGAAMKGHLGGRTKDLQRLCAVVDKAHLSGSDETLPSSMLEALRELVPCNSVTYQVMDPASELCMGGVEVGDRPPCLEPNEERQDAFFWPMFWSGRVIPGV